MKVFNSFTFLKDINPIWYFNLYPENAERFSTYYYNPEYVKISEDGSRLYERDERYSNETAKLLDIGYQLWNKGELLYTGKVKFPELMFNEKPSLKDNYIFVRKYFKSHRVYYFFLKNILRFSNPVKELKALNSTKGIRKTFLINPHCEYSEYDGYRSKLVESSPLVSIIIPTLNRYKYLKDVIEDLEGQDYKNIEIIIIDQTDDPDKKFYENFSISLKVIFQKGKGQWLSRNEAVRNCKGDYLLFFDDDSRVDKDWVFQHLKSLDYFNADISAGVSLSTTGDSVPENYSFFRWADQFDSGNALVKREVFLKTGMFDRQFDKQRMGDGEFGMRAFLAGFRSISNPLAKRIHLKIGTGGLRELGSWDAFRPKNFFAPRPIPSVLYYYRKYFPGSYVVNALILGMYPSLIPYKWKSKKYLYPLSALAAVFIFPVLLIQLGISWSRSSKMLKEGDKIEWL
ncbi:MAG TPA: glycosyltransferase family A protein [Ignavibacteria bacterium]|nr:glycosyltransferase family A protein [Ignavibacteria bacterium]HMR38806.1 glycosyltransferase family A protein [Ignavibacteria bacterium]